MNCVLLHDLPVWVMHGFSASQVCLSSQPLGLAGAADVQRGLQGAAGSGVHAATGPVGSRHRQQPQPACNHCSACRIPSHTAIAGRQLCEG